MLEARGLRKTYQVGAVTLEVLRGVSLRVESGEFLAIMGPSGAGKSTLVHLLIGLDRPTAGEVLWENQLLDRMSEAQRAAFRNATVGVVFQFYHLMPELTALENVMLPGVIRGARSGRAIRDRAQRCLTQVGLQDRGRHKPSALSGGELQRAAIARALMNEPRILLCDEPTGNLDSTTGAGIADLLVRVHHEQRMSLVLVTHELELARRADRTLFMRDGLIEERVPASPGGQQ